MKDHTERVQTIGTEECWQQEEHHQHQKTDEHPPHAKSIHPSTIPHPHVVHEHNHPNHRDASSILKKPMSQVDLLRSHLLRQVSRSPVLRGALSAAPLPANSPPTCLQQLTGTPPAAVPACAPAACSLRPTQMGHHSPQCQEHHKNGTHDEILLLLGHVGRHLFHALHGNRTSARTTTSGSPRREFY